MSVFPYYDVWCDGPGPAGDGCDDWCRSATGPTVREARRLAREAGWVHRRGVGVCGVYTYEVAETKVGLVMDYARKHEHPLQCTMEKE